MLGNKVTRLVGAIIVLTLPAAALQRHLAAAQNASPVNRGNENAVAETTRFAETLRLTAPKGATVPLRVEFKEWYLTRNASGTELPEQGFYIACLASGEVITVISGKSEPRHPGDFWTVDKGARMLVRIKPPREAAILQTPSVSPSL